MDIQSYFQKIFQRWKLVFADSKMRFEALFTFFIYFFLFKFCRIVMVYLEERKGTQLHDIVLENLPIYDLSIIIFTLTYIALILNISSNIVNPRRFLIFLHAYCGLLIMRTITIYLFSLEPPHGMILLVDPVTYLFMNRPNGGYIVKDLFFSGHVSAIVLFYFIAQNKVIKTIFLLLAILVGSFILIQHVHYTIDIIAAPFFSYLAYRLAHTLNSVLYKSNTEIIWSND